MLQGPLGPSAQAGTPRLHPRPQADLPHLSQLFWGWGGSVPAVLHLQKTAGRNQIHRIHGFPHLGTVPKTCASDVTPLRRMLWARSPALLRAPGCAEASASSRLAPDPAQRKQYR